MVKEYKVKVLKYFRLFLSVLLGLDSFLLKIVWEY